MELLNYRYVFTVLLLHLVYSSKLTINIDNANGKDAPECIHGLFSCQTLGYVFKNGSLNNSIINLTNNGSYLLDTSYTFHNLNDFTIQSTNRSIVNCVEKNSGLVFVFAKRISFHNMIICDCGIQQKIDSLYGYTNDPPQNMDPSIFQIAVSFVDCEDIEIKNTIFSENLGIGLVLFDVTGSVVIADSEFSLNTDRHVYDESSNQTYVSGGGIYMLFRKSKQYHQYSNYEVVNTTFCDNMAVNPDDDISEDSGLNKGAGLLINLVETSMNNIIKIKNCTFKNNTAVWGGAVYILLKDKSHNNSLSFQNCTFKSNTAIYGGGGIRLLMSVKLSNTTLFNDLLFTDIKFTENKAIWGGGISISGNTRSIYGKDSKSRDVYFINCVFAYNSATVGFAMGLATINLNKDILGTSPSYRVVISDSQFHRNYMQLTEDGKVIGQGAIYAEELVIALNGNNKFTENNFTSIALDSASLTFKRNSFSEFHNNTALEGGALALYGLSWIMFKKHSVVLFQNNQAYRKGGAIYYKSGGPPRVAFQTTKLRTLKCFIQYEDSHRDPNTWPVNMTFRYNSAPDATGNSVYASTLQFCRQPNEGRISNALNWNFTSFEINRNNQPEIVTNAIDIEVNTSQWNIQPNIPFSPEIVLYDEKNQSVYGSLRIEMKSDNRVSFDPPNDIFLLKDSASRLRITGNPNTKFSFRLFTTSGQMIDTQPYYSEIKECPLGFKLDQNRSKCICMGRTDNTVVHCNEDGSVYILNEQWGYRDKKTNLLATAICPVHYCSCLKEDPMETYLCQFNENQQCSKSRTGILCSKCQPGLSVQFGNEVCTKCTNKNLLLFIPFLIVLFIFVLLIFYFNVDLFSGYLNAFIYSYQMVVFVIPRNIRLDWFIEKIINITSLRGTGGSFGFCLFDGMNNLQKLAINYILPVMMIILTVILGALIPQRVWNKMFCQKPDQNALEQNLQKKSFGRALSFVLVFCYASFTEVTLKLLTWVHINNKRLVYDAAFVEYFHDEHIIYGTLAIFVLLFVVILFPLVLLFTSFFISRVAIIRRNRPVFDALKTCYKQDRKLCQVFVAFYFVSRLFLQVIFVSIQNEINRLIILSIACVVLQVIFSAVQPYQQLSYNLWDMLLLTNMCIISLLSLIMSVPYIASDCARQRSEIALKILVYVPLITVILRLISYIYNKYYQVHDVTDGRGKFKYFILSFIFYCKSS